MSIIISPQFSPLVSSVGGLFIGLAAAMMLLLLGRIAGVSGIVAGLLSGIRKGDAWRLAFVGGLLASGWIFSRLHPLPSIQMAVSPPWLILAGLLVGFGTRLGSGCTSGHGVCGISRGSVRSIVATLCFMGSGLVTVFIVRHVLH